MSDIILNVSDLRTYFGSPNGEIRAVNGVSFTASRGKVLGIVGESGSGKSVTGFSILGLIEKPGRIVSGSVAFCGTEMTTLTEDQLRPIRGNRIAFIFQNPLSSLNPVMRIGTQMIETVLAHDATSRDAAYKRSLATLELMGITSPEVRMRAYPHELSGGMRQRIAIAIAILHKPDLIIADEPTTALDVTIQAQIIYEIQQLVANNNTALIWITHDLSVVAGLADEVAVMYAGKIVEMGDVASVVERPEHPYTRALINSVPSRSRRGTRLPLAERTGETSSGVPAGCSFQPRCAYASAKCEHEPMLMPVNPEHQVSCWNVGKKQ